MTKWKELPPDPLMLAALDSAGRKPDDTEPQNIKRQWSSVFASASAVMLAAELRRQDTFRGHTIYPGADGRRTEFVTGAGGRGRGKKVDVSVSTLSAGLELALTLKGGNFVDPGGGYGKNLTGRLYELLDETKAVHEYHPHANIVCVYYLPLQATFDRMRISTFARAVERLRALTGRVDPLQVTQFQRFDWAAIGLYVPNDIPGLGARGACRYFDVLEDPPRTGRPKLETTMGTRELTARIAELHRIGRVTRLDYAEPEED